MSEHLFPEQAPKPSRELRSYDTGDVEEVLKAGEFNMGDLISERTRDPVAVDAGCIYVQTIQDGEGDPNTRRRRYYFDEDFMGDPQRNVATPLDQVQTSHPGYNIRIGEVWRSPIGDTDGKVEAIVRPWTHGYHQEDTTRGTTPPTVVGKQWLDRAAQAYRR